MTPAQLRAFVTVVRLGSVKAAAADLQVSEAAVSLHVSHLRDELGDKLFVRTASGLAFTPGGLRLASRAAEILGLQDQTIIEVSQAGGGRRLLRVAASSLFAEHAAPGLIELFADRANDLEVELSDQNPMRFASLLTTRAVDVAIGPRPALLEPGVRAANFLNYQVVAVASPEHPLTRVQPSAGELRDQTWLLGPSAASPVEVVPIMLRRLGVSEDKQRIFQSHWAALEEAKHGNGVALVVHFAVARDLAAGDLKLVGSPGLAAQGTWTLMMLSHNATSAAEELARFVITPRATQAMLRGRGVSVGRFKPSIHVTLWS